MDVLGQGLLYCFGAVLGLGDDLEVGLGVEDRLQAGSHDRVVVGDEDAGDERDRHQAGLGGDFEPDLDAAVAAGLDGECAAHEHGAFAHPAQAAAAVGRRLGHPSAVVDHVQHDAVGSTFER